ncbi:alpha-L-rhamnosidase C-terminal domain-containing protein [Actinomadura opuntiae]|uniref:alpha-L-rhamnosidase C-terminal domain-containing protein n=1 Tax=Actinomadura sp. OS1-43 TaxID=604315 RepID=UPI00255A92D6|nr:alpha-L-rhamnosidase C-terminal domain-containing protein [Actinomadura sp. OS1-43]MDL4817286.1 alpha-L-rhamnosidase C-terminal domain-containing protein [Actinomadura sp. OS1-43]
MRRRRSRVALLAAGVVCAAAGSALPVSAADASPPDWRRYVQGPATGNVRPVTAAVLSGNVTHAPGLTGRGAEPTTLTVTPGGPPATVLLDYGKEMVGTPYIDVVSAAAAPPLQLAFSETRKYLFDADGRPTGDGVGTGGYERQQSITPTAHSRVSGTFEGGFRYETITLSTPGTVVLRAAGIAFEAYRATPAQYQGHFLSSSDALNRMWFGGAYTVQTDMAAKGVQDALAPSVLDGAKRDRKIWSGDLAIEGPAILASLGSNGAPYVKKSLLALLKLSKPGSGLAGFGVPSGGSNGLDPAYSNTYSSWTADDAVGYFRATADTDMARQILPYVEGQITYDSTLTDADGLLVTANVFGGPNSGLDWDIYDGPKAGVVAATNMLYYRVLTDAAYLETQLGNGRKATEYLATATRIKKAINARLFNPATGAYGLGETARGTIAQDANSLAILFGIAPQDKVPGIVRALKTLWDAHGSRPFSADADLSTTHSPFITGLEVEALYKAGYATDAEKLLALTWNQMIDPKNPNYTGTFWENYLPDGTLQDGSISASHGWSAGPTPALTGYALGVQPVDPGYRTFTVSPHFGTLNWANGVVPTPYGPITVTWTRRGARHELTVKAPSGTTATVQLPGHRPLKIHGTTETLTSDT